MKNFYRFLGLSLALIASICTASSNAETLFSYDFKDSGTFATDFRVDDLSGYESTSSWSTPTWYSYAYTYSTPAYYYARCYSYSKSSYDDYMTTRNAVALQPGHAYKLSYDFWDDGNDSGRSAIMEFGYGTGEDQTAYTMTEEEVGVYVNKYSHGVPAHFVHLFEVEEAGNYYFTFHSKGSGGIGLTNIVLEDAGNPNTPEVASAFIVTPDENFEAKATLSITLPSKTVTGGELASISAVKIYRGESLVATLTEDLTPGATISWADKNAEEGDVTYSVVIVNGELESAALSATAYIGALTPACPSSVTAADMGGNNISLSWVAPTLSTNGIALSSSLLKYKIARSVDGEEAVIAESVSDTSYEDSYQADERVSIVYKVYALYGDKVSEAAESNVIKVGTVVLPYEDSFADGVLSSDWTIEYEGSSYAWVVKSSGTNPSCSPQDEDGGMLFFQSYNATSGSSSRIYTPYISAEGTSNVIIEYWMYNYSYGSKDDRVVVDVRQSGGDWVEVSNSTVKLNNGDTGWHKYTVSLQSYIDGAESFQVGIRALSEYGNNIHVDNISIYNARTYDVKAEAISLPESVTAGNDVEIKASVTNKGAYALEAGAYTVVLNMDGNALDLQQSVETAVEATVEYTFTVPTDATMISETPHTISVNLIYADDEELNNNSSEAALTIVGSSNPRVKTVSTEQTDNSIILSWLAPIDKDGYIPTDITENFTNCEVDDEGNVTGSSWAIVNLDEGEASGASYGFKSNTWTVFAPTSSSTYAPTAKDGDHFLAMISPYSDYSNDWLISPELNPFEGSKYTVSISALCNTSDKSLNVCYSTTDDDPESFVVADVINMKTSSYPNWYFYEYSATVPGTAKYIAIQNATKGSTVLMGIDRISVKSSLAEINGYNVYQDLIRINEEPITETQYEIPFNMNARSDDSMVFNISAIYDDGESALSDSVVISLSGVKDVNNGAYGVTIVDGGIITASAATVYSLDGRRIAQTEADRRTSLAPGIYIVRTNGKSIKVLLK